LNAKRINWFEKQLQRLNSADLSSDEKVMLKIELAEQRSLVLIKRKFIVSVNNQTNRSYEDERKRVTPY
jgi:hypothetical protein